uniref:Uncharacterized protein n=1 Tax=CrAss-like virus sp. ctWDt29 TaxID=2825836 RepID=A0A8S5NWK8_9CAUD|nr:MAG TPA: hypothetical protein [CrAss-like virus sp. ctWDt29]
MISCHYSDIIFSLPSQFIPASCFLYYFHIIYIFLLKVLL